MIVRNHWPASSEYAAHPSENDHQDRRKPETDQRQDPGSETDDETYSHHKFDQTEQDNGRLQQGGMHQQPVQQRTDTERRVRRRVDKLVGEIARRCGVDLLRGVDESPRCAAPINPAQDKPVRQRGSPHQLPRPCADFRIDARAISGFDTVRECFCLRHVLYL